MTGSMRLMLGLVSLALAGVVLAAQSAPVPSGPIRFAEGRYELGRRTRALERAWMQCQSVERRTAAIPRVQTAVLGFFSGNTGVVAQALDETAAMLSDQSVEAADRWAMALSIMPTRALLDLRETTCEVLIAALYEINAPRPELALQLKIGRQVTNIKLSPQTALPYRVRIACGSARQEADTGLDIVVGTPDVPARQSWRVGLSRARNLDQRLRALQTATAELTKTPFPDALAADMATLSARLTMLKALREGTPAETDLPAVHLLQDTEAMVQRLRAKPTRSTLAGRQGELFLSIPTAKGTCPVRALAAPEASVVVVAFHGAGGSENMFFDSYGDGEIVRLCRARGWGLICPRVTSPLDDYSAVIEQLPSLLSPKATRLFIVGHSLGAATTLLVAGKYADRLTGIAPISGRALGSLAALKSVPVFVAAGTKDFSRPGSEQLAERLRAQGTPTTFKLYEAEHLLVVPDALPDIFRWMDELVRN
ncbi:MAG: alpha/beta hydrolase [Acidobacteriota bacterium]